MLPAYMTATRSATCETTARSCEMKSMARPNFVRSSASRSRICAWMVTSSAVVGSSAMSKLRAIDDGHGDHDALAHAAGKLMRIVAGAAGGVGNGDVVHGVDGAVRSLLSWKCIVGEDGFGDLVADAHDRVERGHGLLKNHGDARAAELAHVIVGKLEEIARRCRFRRRDISPEMRACGGSRRMSGERGDRICRSRIRRPGRGLRRERWRS